MSTSYELILDDTSPVINYYPFAETLGAPNLLAGWNSYFSQSGFLSQLGETGQGDSLHVTSLDGAVLTIQWFGTGITLFGSVVDGAYQVSIDGASPSIGLPRQDVLAEFQGLQLGSHLVALISHINAAAFNTSSYLAFDRAALNISTDIVGASISSEVVGVTSPRWLFSGNWTEVPDQGITSPSPQPYCVSNIRSSTASIAFTGSAVTLTGIRNITHGRYNITLDGTTTTFDGHSDWLENSTLFLQAGLNETLQHTLTITNADDATVAITGVNITHVSGGAAREVNGPGVSTGTVVGVVFAVLLGVLVVVTAVTCWYFFFRRQRDRRPGFTKEGISSENFFRDLDSRWPSIRKHRPTYLSRNSEPDLQNLYITAPQSGNDAERGETDGDRDRMDSPVVLIARKIDENIDVTSPTPYLRSSKISSFVANSPSRGDWGLSQSESVGGAGMESVMQDPLSSDMRPESGVVDPSAPPRPKSRRRGSLTDTSAPLKLHVQIPQLRSASGPLTGTPTSRARRGSLLLQSPLRGSRRAMQRYSETPSQDIFALPSVSTIRFADDRRGSTSISARTAATVEVTPASPPLPKDKPFRISERLRDPRSQKGRGAIPGPSDWKPPW